MTLNIRIISVGKIKEKYLKLGIDEFKKRLRLYCKLSIIEVPDEQAPEHLSDKELQLIKEREGEKILSKIKQDDYVIALDLKGESLSSEQFSRKLRQISFAGKNQICFLIGGSNGLGDNVLKRAEYKLSFSNMTFPHQLMRLILLEQIYRAFKIQRNEPYHK
mgnify:FL=1